MFKKSCVIGIVIFSLALILVVGVITGAGCPKRNKDNKVASSSGNDGFIINAPTNLTATAVSYTQINLSWQDNSNNEDGFEIWRSDNGISYDLLARLGVNTYFYSDAGLPPVFTCYYRVRAYNTIGDNSGYSNDVSALTFNRIWMPDTWALVDAGWAHNIGLTPDGTVWSWGANDVLQLGIGDTRDRNLPVPVGTDSDWLVLTDSSRSVFSAGDYHNLAVKTNGTLWGWGTNGAGQLGFGSTEFDGEIPYQIGSDSDWFNITAGNGHSVAIKNNRTIWSWGGNGYGQLGLGDTDSRFAPGQIGTLSDWSIVSARSGHTVAIKTNRTIWSWGVNSNGQLGLGHNSNVNTPTQIGTNSDWMIITTSRGQGSGYGNYGHTMALKTDRTLWAWGRNDCGELGIGNLISRNTPALISTEMGWSFIGAGTLHSFAVKTNNTLWACGSNGNYELGISDDTSNRLTFTQVVTSSDWFMASGGELHSIGLKTDGSLWSWGANTRGQLGLGDTLSRSIPVKFGSPPQPLSFDITMISTTAISLSWVDICPDEFGFRIERKVGMLGSWSEIAIVGPNITYYLDDTVTFGNAYYYRVRAYNSVGYGPYTGSIDTYLTGAFSNLQIALITETYVSLIWYEGSDNETGFKVERKISAGGSWGEIGTTSADVRTYNDTTIIPGDIHYYRVRIFNYFDNGWYSSEANTSPATPSGLIISSVSPTQISLVWNDTVNETAYSIERRIGSNPTWQQIGTSGIDIVSYNDISASGFAPATYRYRVKASNSVCNGLPSNEALTSTGDTWQMLSAGSFTVGKKSNGTLWSWGWNDPGSLGIGTIGNRTTPTQIGTSTDWSMVSAGYAHTIALKNDKTLWSWGYNMNNELGFGDNYSRNYPNQVGGTPGPHPALTATLISLSRIDLTWTDTNNETGFQIMRNDVSLTNTLSANTISYSDTTVTANNTYNYRIKSINNVGETLSLQVSIIITDTYVPKSDVKTSFPTAALSADWSIVAAGKYHSLAIKTDNSLWIWGTGITPTRVGTANDWVKANGGGGDTGEFRLALKNNGTLWAWGGNWYGQLGVGGNTDRSTPTQVGTTSDWSNFSAGNEHSIAVKTNNTLWAWGNNNNYQLGLGDVNVRYTPVQVGTNSDWSNVSSGSDHNIVIKTNQTIWAWGYNGEGRLGIPGGNRSSPTQIGNGSDWSMVFSGKGNYHSGGVKNNGTLWTWGYNAFGQLGVGDIINRPTPTLIGE